MTWNGLLLKYLVRFAWVPISAVLLAVAMQWISPIYCLLAVLLSLALWVRLRSPLSPVTGMGIALAVALAFFAVRGFRDLAGSLVCASDRALAGDRRSLPMVYPPALPGCRSAADPLPFGTGTGGACAGRGLAPPGVGGFG